MRALGFIRKTEIEVHLTLKEVAQISSALDQHYLAFWAGKRRGLAARWHLLYKAVRDAEHHGSVDLNKRLSVLATDKVKAISDEAGVEIWELECSRCRNPWEIQAVDVPAYIKRVDENVCWECEGEGW